MDFYTLLKNYMDVEHRLTAYPTKRKLRIIAMMYLSTKFEKGHIYNEREVNAILNASTTFEDPCTLRREMYNHRFFDRKSDGREYWLEPVQPELSSFKLD